MAEVALTGEGRTESVESDGCQDGLIWESLYELCHGRRRPGRARRSADRIESQFLPPSVVPRISLCPTLPGEAPWV
jgi:hypothetical protein